MNRVSIIIPAHNEQEYLNRTIDSFIGQADSKVEVIVILNGYDQKVDERAIVIKRTENEGMRKALNLGASVASGDVLFFTDAHCSITKSWDTKMLESLSLYPNGIIQAPIVSIDKKDWSKTRGYYGFCEMRPNMQPVWKGKKNYAVTEKNMAITGCGMMMLKQWYLSWGGLDESLSKMGAIGSEFSIHGWLDGDGIYTRTDVKLGHVFTTGGYDTAAANKSQEILHQRYGDRYKEIVQKYSGEQSMQTKSNQEVEIVKEQRVVTVERRDEHITTDTKTGKPVIKKVEIFRYVHIDNGKGLTEEQIREKYASRAVKVEEEIYYPKENGEWVRAA